MLGYLEQGLILILSQTKTRISEKDPWTKVAEWLWMGRSSS